MLKSPLGLGQGTCADLLQRCVDLLEAQREEILDLLPHAARVRSPNIRKSPPDSLVSRNPRGAVLTLARRCLDAEVRTG